MIVRVMTPEHGLMAGYVRGGKSRSLRPVLLPANSVTAEFRMRNAEQLPGLSIELDLSRGPLMGEPLAAAAIDWVTALSAFSLPENQHYPNLFQTLDAVLSAIESAPAARQWAGALAAYEVLLLRSLGYGSGGTSIPSDWPETFALLNANGAQLGRYIFQGRSADILLARGRLMDRLKRAVA